MYELKRNNHKGEWYAVGIKVAEKAYDEYIGDDENRELNRYRFLDYAELLWDKGLSLRDWERYKPYIEKLKELGKLADAAIVDCRKHSRIAIIEPEMVLEPIIIHGFNGRLKSAGAMTGDVKRDVASRLRALKSGKR